MTVLEMVHETRYDYAAPVSLAHHLAHLQPLEDAHQQLLAFELDVDPAPAQRRDSCDAMGNAQRHFSLLLPHERLRVRASSRVRVQPRFAGLRPALSPAWDGVASSLRYVARAPYRPAVEFAMPSPHVPRLEVLRDYAAPSLPPGRPLAEAALELMHRIYTDFAYDSESTEIDTPLAQVVAQRRGVCQDFAHLMAGALRMWGLPARYVSGYLLTQAPEGGAQMLGADASHAWVQVWCPGTPGVPAAGAGAGWLDLDPTNDLVPGSGHVRLAVGRDYADVTPLRGVIRGGGGSHTLSVAVRTRVVELAVGASPEAAPEAGPRVASVNPQES
ncbi:MAG: transglutaminase family protein [Rubrivivax sp.]|nr:transglutaminase family protein [Rubrivivax sp.]